MRRGLLSLVCGLTAVALAGAGCAKDPEVPGSGGGGSGGGGSGGSDAGPPAACDPTASTMGRVTTPAPLISVGKRVSASAGVNNAAKVADGLYHNGGAATFPTTVSDASPAWIAIEVVPGADGGTGPTRLMLAWTDNGYVPYNMVAGGAPGAYRIETSGDSTDGADGAWTMVASVTGNGVGARAHTFDFTGKTWVRFAVTATASGVTPTLDEIEIHDVSASGSDRPADTWFFFGDSITQGAFQRDLSTRFDTSVHAAHTTYNPVMLNGGIGGELSSMGVEHVNTDGWLSINADFQHVAILFGTNDSWGNKNAASSGFEANMTTIVDAVLAAGRVPILARIPFATDPATGPTMHATIPDFNAIIDRITATKGLPCGPDFYSYFKDHPDQLGPDGVHPSPSGYGSMNKLWAEAVSGLYQ